MGSFAYCVFGQVRAWLTQLDGNNFSTTQTELIELSDLFGWETDLYVVRLVLEEINFRSQDSHEVAKVQLLKCFLDRLFKKKRALFAQVTSHALESNHVSCSFFKSMVEAIELPLIQELYLAVGLAVSANSDVQEVGIKFLKSRLTEIKSVLRETKTASPNEDTDINNGSENTLFVESKMVPHEVAHELAYYFRTMDFFSESEKESLGLNSEIFQNSSIEMSPLVEESNIINSKRKFNEISDGPSTLSLSERVSSSVHISNLMLELGYSFCSSPTLLKRFFGHFPDIAESEVARMISVMIHTPSGLGTPGFNPENQSAVSLKKANACMPDILGILSDGSDDQMQVEVKESTSNEVDSESPHSWNVPVFMKTLTEKYPRLNWQQVWTHLDYPEFFVGSKEGLVLLLDIIKLAPTQIRIEDLIFREWENKKGQFSVMKISIQHGFITETARMQQEIPRVSVPTASRCWYSLDLIETLLALGRSDLYTAVRRLFKPPLDVCPEVLVCGLAQVQAEGSHLKDELERILIPAYLNPHKNSDIVIPRLWQLNKPLLSRWLVKFYLDRRLFLQRILQICRSLDPNSGLVIPPSSNTKFRIDLATMASAKAGFDLKSWLLHEAGQMGDEFVMSCVDFLTDNIKRIQENQINQGHQHINIVGVDGATEIFECFGSLKESLQSGTNAYVERIYRAYCSANSQADSSTSVDAIEEAANSYFQKIYDGKLSIDEVGNFNISTKLINEFVDKYFKQMYDGKISVEEVIRTLTHFKYSHHVRDSEVFACMIHNLFDEYRFFHKYPPKELKITGILFGQLVRNKLLAKMTLAMALRYVLDSLKKPVNHKLFQFGIWALDQFKDMLYEWPSYCARLAALDHLLSHQRDLVQILQPILAKMQEERTGDNQQQTAAHFQDIAPEHLEHMGKTAFDQSNTRASKLGPPARGIGVHSQADASQHGLDSLHHPSTHQSLGANLYQEKNVYEKKKEMNDNQNATIASAVAAATAGKGGMLTSHDVSTLLPNLEEHAPDEPIQEQLREIINNITPRNANDKAKQLGTFLKEKKVSYYYFAMYMCVKRCSVEYNFQDAYLSVLDKMNNSELLKMILGTTYTNIKALLNSEKILDSSSERSLLKNLGSWLSKLTLAKNKPIIAKELDLKKLILNACRDSRLIVVIPFVAKILDSCGNSKVFKPPNPWSMAILSLLHEIYNLSDLKLTLKFEIEVLFNKLKIKFDDVEPSTLVSKLEAIGTGAGNFPADATQHTTAREAQPQSPPQAATQATSAVPRRQIQPPQQPVQQPAVDSRLSRNVPNVGRIPQFVTISPELTIFEEDPNLKQAVPLAIERAIREIVAPVTERSVHIACITARELIQKDFAFDADEEKMRMAAHQMVRSLTSSLALVTCKDPLRASIQSNLKEFLRDVVRDPVQLEIAVKKIAEDNLMIGCDFVEKSAADRAAEQIDRNLADDYDERRKHRETGGYFFASKTYQPPAGRFPSILPEAMRPKATGLTKAQFQVYQDYANVRSITEGDTGVQMSSQQSTNLTSAGMVSSQQHGAPDRNVGQQQGGTATLSRPQPGDSHPGIVRLSTPQVVEDGKHEPKSGLQNELRRLESTIETIQNNEQMRLYELGRDHAVQYIIGALYNSIRAIATPPATSNTVPADMIAFAHEVFSSMHRYGNSLLQIDAHLEILKAIRVVCSKLVKELSKWVIYGHDDQKFNIEITSGLVRQRLIDLTELDMSLSKELSADGSNHWRYAVHFCTNLLTRVLIKDNSEHRCSPSDFIHTIDTLARVFETRRLLLKGSEGPTPTLVNNVASLLKQLRTDERSGLPQNAGDTTVVYGEKEQSSEDPPGFRQKVAGLLHQWKTSLATSTSQDKAEQQFLQLLENQGVLKGEHCERFFRHAVEIVFDSPSDPGHHPYHNIDAICRLIVTLVKTVDNVRPHSYPSKMSLLNQILAVVGHHLRTCHNSQGEKFNQRPFFRLFVNLLQDLCSPDPLLDNISTQILIAFANNFHSQQPSRVPGFCFAWVELISHRSFMPRLLLTKNKYNVKCRTLFHKLLVDLFQFMEPFLKNARLTDSIRLLYKGTLRVLLVLLHDFPEFLCEFHFSFCDVIPPSCIQMRNLILSAFPRNMRLPDPFLPNLKVDLLPEISQGPTILSDTTSALMRANNAPGITSGIKEDIDNYLNTLNIQGTAIPRDFFRRICNKLILPRNNAEPDLERTTHYNVPLMNSLVMYLGIQAINKMQNTKIGAISHASMDIFLHLIAELDEEGRYYFLNAIANQLRFPNNHTHFFSCVLLVLFNDASQEMIQEQITRVLLERLIVHRPHPWGLLITFIELIKNPRYDFWRHGFTRCASEIERLFQSVARSCIQQPKKDEIGQARVDI